jgi:hypothetical protein
MEHPIVIVPIDDAEERLWRVTHEIADLLAGLPWVLIGGQMVTLLEREHGGRTGRATRDVDALMDVRALTGPRLMNRLPARYLLTPGLLLLAAGLVLLSQLTPDTAYAPLILVAELVLGFGAGLNGTLAIYAALSGTAAADTGVTSAMSSTSNQIGASIGTAALSTMAAGATTSYMASHAAVAATTGLSMASQRPRLSAPSSCLRAHC